MADSVCESGEGFRGLTREVDDIEETLAPLKSNGVQTFEQGGVVFVHPKSANGVIISLTKKD